MASDIMSIYIYATHANSDLHFLAIISAAPIVVHKVSVIYSLNHEIGWHPLVFLSMLLDCEMIRQSALSLDLGTHTCMLLYLKRCAGVYESIPQSLIAIYTLVTPDLRESLQSKESDLYLVIFSLLMSLSIIVSAIVKIDRTRLNIQVHTHLCHLENSIVYFLGESKNLG